MKNMSFIKKNLPFLSTKRMRVILAAAIILIIIIIGLFFAVQPPRTIANFCQTVKEQKSILVGDVNYEKRVEAYKKLEAVSPDDIRPDITAIRKGYEEIVKNPSNTLGAGFGMAGSENRRDAFIKTNCKDL